MSMSPLLSFEDLCRWYGTDQSATIVRYLERDRVPYTRGRDGKPITTEAAINRSLIGDREQADEFDFSVSA